MYRAFKDRNLAIKQYESLHSRGEKPIDLAVILENPDLSEFTVLDIINYSDSPAQH